VREWREIRPLYLAGALLTRLTAPPLKTNYRYDVPHIDKAVSCECTTLYRCGILQS
jgi:hypothetical protein